MTVDEETIVVMRRWVPGKRVTFILAEPVPEQTVEQRGENVLRNGSFDDGAAGWTLNPATAGTVAVVADGGHESAARVAITAVSGNVQWYQAKIALTPTTEYELAFQAHGNAARAQKVILIQHATPNANIGVNETVQLTTEWQTYVRRFTTPGDVDLANCRLRFALAGVGEWYFDDVAIVPITRVVTGGGRREYSRLTAIPAGSAA